MHIYIVVSSIYIGYLIYSHCTRKNYEDEIVDEYMNLLWQHFPQASYLNRIINLNFFSDEEQFTRLCKITDNPEIYEKMLNIIENDTTINKDYNNTKSFLTEEFFCYDHPIDIPIEINGRIFKTNLQRLYVIRWFIMNDYFLFIE